MFDISLLEGGVPNGVRDLRKPTGIGESSTSTRRAPKASTEAVVKI